MADIDQDQTTATEIMADILIIEICGEQRRYHRRYPRDNRDGIKPWKSLNSSRDQKKR